jgi:hypothetical protein
VVRIQWPLMQAAGRMHVHTQGPLKHRTTKKPRTMPGL